MRYEIATFHSPCLLRLTQDRKCFRFSREIHHLKKLKITKRVVFFPDTKWSHSGSRKWGHTDPDDRCVRRAEAAWIGGCLDTARFSLEPGILSRGSLLLLSGDVGVLRGGTVPRGA